MKSRLLSTTALALAAVVLTSSCKDEQRLYSYDEEPGTSAAPAANAPAVTGALPEGHPPLPEQLPAGHPPINITDGNVAVAEPPADRARLPENVALKTVELAGINISIPEAWNEIEPTSQMRLAQFQIPSEGGAAPADLVVFYFGQGQGGDAMSNVSRWIGQMSPDPQFSPVVFQQKKSGHTITEVYVEGTINPSSMGGPTTAQPNSALHGIILEGGPQGSLFIKITGPRDTVKSVDPAIATMVDKLG